MLYQLKVGALRYSERGVPHVVLGQTSCSFFWRSKKIQSLLALAKYETPRLERLCAT